MKKCNALTALFAVLTFTIGMVSAPESFARKKCWQQCDGNGNCQEICDDFPESGSSGVRG